MTARQTPFQLPVKAVELGAWEPLPGMTYSGRQKWEVIRRNPAFRFGREYLLTESKRDPRKFYSDRAAQAECDRLNAAITGSQP
jgi:hypothetical protein